MTPLSRSKLAIAFVLPCLIMACGPSSTGGGRGGGAGRGGSGGVGGTAGVGGTSSGGGPSNPCDRATLKPTVDSYFAALSAHDSSRLALASNVKYTENGRQVQVGDGLWRTAGALKFKRSALDEGLCTSVTESVITENGADIVFGLRLKSVEQKLSEIEAIIVRAGDWFPTPQGVLGTASDDWETPIPEAERSTRAKLDSMMQIYFERFPAGGCDFAPECRRYENGFSPGLCSLGLSCGAAPARPVMTTRLLVADVPAGITVGFTMFAGAYTDFHMFKVRGGQVRGVHAVLAGASSSGW
jgi:hypothetical protein